MHGRIWLIQWFLTAICCAGSAAENDLSLVWMTVEECIWQVNGLGGQWPPEIYDWIRFFIETDAELNPSLWTISFSCVPCVSERQEWSPKSFEKWYLAPPPSGKIICLTLNIDQWKFRFRKWKELIPLMRRANSTDEKSSDRCWEICFAWILAILYDIKKEQTVQNSCCDGVCFVFCRW